MGSTEVVSISGSFEMKPSVVQETTMLSVALIISDRVVLIKLVIHPAYKGLTNSPEGNGLVELDFTSNFAF